MNFHWIRWISVLVLLLASSSCSKDKTDAVQENSMKRNVYMITATGLRADHLSSYMYQPIQTPGLDFLAYDGVRFTRAFSTSTDSLPAHQSMLTGLFPIRKPVVQVYEYFQTFTNESLPESKTSMPILLRNKGYRTAAFAADPELRSFVLRSGWFDKSYAGNSMLPPWQPSTNSEGIRSMAIDWISAMRDRPHFVLMNFFEPTPPYAPPEPYNHHYENHPYDGEVAALDQQIEHFIHWLKISKLFERSIVIFTAPYGENPEGVGRAGSVEDGNLKVPLMIAAPGLLPRQQMYETAVNIADLFPTVLALLNLSPPSQVDGKKLFEKNSDKQITHDFIYGGSLFPMQLGNAPRWFVWSDGWKLVSDAENVNREEGFPMEVRPETIKKKEQELRALLEKINGRGSGDQKSSVTLDEAIILARSEHYADALKRVQNLSETPAILSLRSALLASTSNLDLPKKLLASNHPELLLQLADLEIKRGNINSAAEALAKYNGIKSYDIYSTISIVLKNQGKLEEAQKNIDLALRLNPQSAEAHRQQGLIYFEEKNYARAETLLRKALGLQPNRLEVMVELAETLMKLGKSEEGNRLAAAVLIQSAAPEIRERARKLLAE